MRNPLTRDRLNAAFPGRPDIVRAFEEIAQVTEETPNSIEDAQLSSVLAADAAASARAAVGRLAEGLDLLVAEVLLSRSQRTEIAALARRLDALETLTLAGGA